MYLNNYQYLKNEELARLSALVIFSIIIRIPIILIFGDTSLENEWKILVNNLINYKILAFDYLDPALNKYLIPNIWMPPLYAYYLYFFSIFNLETQNYINLVLFSQIFLSSISVAVFYKINKIFFSKRVSFYCSLIFSIFPLNLYSCSQISSITLQVFLTIFFFYFILQFTKKKNFSSLVSFSFVSGLIILLRGEFIAILLISLFYLFIFFKVEVKKIILILLINFITISPYLVRNVIVFDTFALTKSFGFNLWKGNNPSSKVEGGVFIEKNLRAEINDIKKDKFYGINFDNIFFERAVKNIEEDPIRYFKLFIKKILSFLFIDIESSKQNYYKALHYLPVLLIGITSLIGIIISDKKSKKMNYLILIFFIYVLIFSLFFILPRYKLVILPMQLIFTNIFVEYILKKFLKHHG